MGKKTKRTMAVLTLVIFFWLNHLSLLPLPAIGGGKQGNSFSATEATPGSVEKVGSGSQQGRPSKKKLSPMVIMIGVVVLGMTAGALTVFVFKNRYDINGTWQFLWNYPGTYAGEGTVTFSGTIRSGEISANWGTGEDAMQGYGTFQVEKKELSFNIIWDEWTNVSHQGEFLDNDTIGGTLTAGGGVTGTWSAARIK